MATEREFVWLNAMEGQTHDINELRNKIINYPTTRKLAILCDCLEGYEDINSFPTELTLEEKNDFFVKASVKMTKERAQTIMCLNFG